MDTVFDSISEADTENKFREMRAAFPDMYCPACVPGEGRTDSERYAELRKLVELWQSHTVGSSQSLADWRHR